MPTPCNITCSNIPGGSEKQGREDSSDVFELEHQVQAPSDTATGLPSGMRVHTPLRVTKVIDKASPLLFKALVEAQTINEVKLDFYRIDPATRAEALYYSVVLGKCRVINFRPFMPTSFVPANESFRHMEQVSFVYETIELRWLPDNISAFDEWTKPSGGDKSMPF